MKRTIVLSSIAFAISALVFAQIKGVIQGNGEKPAIAVPDFRGAGDAQRLMDPFNGTLFRRTPNLRPAEGDSQNCLSVAGSPAAHRPSSAAQWRSQGPWLTDWSGPPVNANYLAFGYTAAQNNQLVLYGWLYDVTQSNTSSAQLIGKVYLGSLDEAGAAKVAQRICRRHLETYLAPPA